ncbi:hypothetical protein BU25DRAFT_420731 [Macroventuria anomochaeta]|uniref:Uncharacterized protein n=1 Tax=Macroventuria anomochaeta TaxID=301207 RepID=A0ACB6S3P7_9PLEO|nr:uncharacterized protein BU25DRAFT_420731 [Macroventuria anomochaeta]KAF2628786.1 hypothetical protein BU25DRAFT_420731 [Macroventuria anomochaeta]
MNIQSLLNSPSGGSGEYQRAAPPCPPSAQRCLAHSVVPKRQKLAKDAPVFSEGTKIVGHVNYPPHEAGNDRILEARHREFSVFPLGQILKKGVRHIPYASDKKDFLDKTGRDAFKVIQYTFKRPGEDREYVVVWDYNVGLVRMTPFFKSCKYPKTVPAKALNQNPGMKDISYSITGGALVCQGYWVPWQAAREIAATFCWDIRWALTPVFGNDFPQICRPPHDRSFAKFVIDPEIVRFCTLETARFKEEGASYRLLQSKALSPVMTPIMAPPTPVLTPPTWKQDVLPVYPESGYGTDIERNGNTVFSPQVSPRSLYIVSRFTSVNGAEPPTSPNTTYSSATCTPVVAFAPTPLMLPTSIPDEPYCKSFRTKRTYSKVAYNDSDCGVAKIDTPHNEVPDPIQDTCPAGSHSPRTLEAAEILMSLSVVARNVAALPEPKRTRRDFRS